MLSSDTINQYKRSRGWTDKSLICHAPFVNLNFEQNGNITACCYNRKEVLGRYPEQSILDAWYSAPAESLRKLIAQNQLEGGCSACKELLDAGNYKGVKALTYDEFAAPKWWPTAGPKANQLTPLPKVLELEISNLCNLECSMCNGYFSSTIRKNREGLAPLPMVYDQAFVEQVKDLMPGLTDIKFLGGEPFLIDLYYDIWEAIPEINPNIRVHITTNGTVLNQRAKNILEKLKVGIVVSIDSIEPENYQLIRKGGNFPRLMENLEFFRAVVKGKRTYLSIAACALKNNWQDIPGLLHFCNDKSIKLHFNMVWTPEGLSLKSCSKEELKEIIGYLEKSLPDTRPWQWQSSRNVQACKDLISTLKYWWAEKFRTAGRSQETYVPDSYTAGFHVQEDDAPEVIELLYALLSADAENGSHQAAQLIELIPASSELQLADLPYWQTQQLPEEMNRRILSALCLLNRGSASEPEKKQFLDKTKAIENQFNEGETASKLLTIFLATPILEQVIHIRRLPKEELLRLLTASIRH
jgi:MoaA/NifB/PqqE/SkfB family radical SAM enzyme